MATKLTTRREWLDKVKLDGGTRTLDTSSVVGAASTKAILTAMETGDYDNVENVLTLNGIIRTTDGTNNTMVVGKRELYVLSNGKGQTRNVESDAMVTKLEQAGWQVVDVKIEDIVA
mgnify:FL=1|tara:strand:+ start:2145 stop:2495 length:351 start_codon:yes stop_codon:yes gene_type:complete